MNEFIPKRKNGVVLSQKTLAVLRDVGCEDVSGAVLQDGREYFRVKGIRETHWKHQNGCTFAGELIKKTLRVEKKLIKLYVLQKTRAESNMFYILTKDAKPFFGEFQKVHTRVTVR